MKAALLLPLALAFLAGCQPQDGADGQTMPRPVAEAVAASQSPGELARRLDTVQRGTSRSPYTAEQLHRARKAKGLE